MKGYILGRMALIPLTLFAILFVNFVILNLAPGDPSTVSSAGVQGDGARQAGREGDFDRDDQYLAFREHYGLTLPILYNRWPSTSQSQVLRSLQTVVDRRVPGAHTDMQPRRYKEFRIRFADQAHYLLPQLLAIASDPSQSEAIRQAAVRFFVRGATRMGFVGPQITREQRAYNRKIADDNAYLRALALSDKPLSDKLSELTGWYEKNREFHALEPSVWQRWGIFFGETRLTRYLTKMATLDFGTLRSDSNRTVTSEVAKRFKYSLTLAILPMVITFVLCQFFGFLMACKQKRWPDHSLNVVFLALYAVPIFVVAPFLIEKVALPHGLPVSGFHSDDALYDQMTSWQRLGDIMRHLALPLLAVTYGTLAVESRLSRTAVLEVMRQDYVRTAHAKGVHPLTVLWKHIGRNASITIVTALSASLGAVLAGSLIVETIFGIDGFGRFFYDSIINRDYNVILFSTIVSALLALVGYLVADIAYTLLDPRVSLR